jgi:hypothetical protein
MSEYKKLQIDVDTKQATKAMDDLAKSTKDVAQEFDNAATFAERYGDELQPLTTRMGEAEDRLYELANAGQTATQEYKDLLNTVANYRKVQIQTDMAVDAASSTFSTKLGGALGGVTAGFSIAQGAMGAFGVESEDLEKQLLKVQSAMAIAEGVKGFREAIPAIKAFGTAMKAAIGSTGIGLLVVALGTVAAYWDDIKAAVSGVSSEQEKLNAKAQANVNIQQKKFDSISGQENILRLQGKTEKQITEMKLTQIRAVIKATEAQLAQQEATKKAEVAATKRNQDYLKLVFRIGLESAALVLRYLSAPIDLAIKGANKVAEVLGFGKITSFSINEEITKFTSSAAKSAAEYFFDPKATANEADKTINETKAKLGELKNQAAGFQLELNEINKPAEKTVSTSSTKVVEEAKKEVEAMEVFKLESVRSISSQIQEERRKELEAEMQNSLEKRRIAKEEADAIIALEAEKKKAREDALTATASTLGQIADLFGEQSAAGKAAAIAQATIDTYLSAQKAYTSTVGIPIVGPVLAPINAGLAIAAGIKNIKAITAVKTPGNGGGGSGNISNNFGGSAAQAPSFNVVGNSGMNQLAQIQQTPIQAFVVSGEVTSAQALDRNRVKNATL